MPVSPGKGTVPNQPQSTAGGGDWWNPLDWFSAAGSAASDWLGGLGGDVASGVEGGIIATFKDLFAVAIPFIEIIAGALLFLWAFVFYFKDDIMALGGTLMRFV